MPLTTTKASASAYGLGFTSGKQIVGPYLAAINITTGSSLFPTPLKTNGQVYAIESDGAGGVYVGGTFTTINDEPRNCLAHINSSGLVTTWNPSVNSTVYVIKRLGSNVYFGGNFTSVSGQTRSKAAGFNTAGTLLGWNPNVAWGTVYAMTTIGVNVYFGGEFELVSGNTRLGTAGMNVSGSFLTAWSADLSRGGSAIGWCYSMSSIGTNVYIFGEFISIKGTSRTSAGAVSTGNALLAWSPSLSGASQGMGTVVSSAVVGTSIFFGGQFDSSWGASNGAGWAADNTRLDWYPMPNGRISAIFAADGQLHIGGNFTTLDNGARQTPYYGITNQPGLNGTTSFITENVTPNGWVRAISANGSNVFIGGDFTNAAS